MITAIAYNLRNLTNFKGRDGRRVFWSYFLFVILLNVVISIAASIPTVTAAVNEGQILAQAGNDAAAKAAITDRMIGLAEPLVWVGLICALLNILLLSAAFVRRAHDSGLPGMFLFIPLGLQLIWMYFSYSQLGGVEQTLQATAQAQQAGAGIEVQAGMIAQDLIGWLAVIIVAVIGSVRTQQGGNQYGDAPVEL